MKKTNQIVIGLIWLLIHQIAITDPMLTFFFKNYPNIGLSEKTVNALSRPHGIAKQHLYALLNRNPISGIFVTYFGFLDASDSNGQVSFPRKQSKALFQLVITNRITPITMFQNTISHWELDPAAAAELYTLELKEDENTKLSFWNMQKAPLPFKGQLDATQSIIIIAKPQNIYIPTGITVTQPSANLILPDVYVKKGIQSIRNALYTLNLSLFFRPIDLLYKKEKMRYEELINE